MTTTSPALLSDRDLLEAVARAAGHERRAMADLLTLLAELDARKLYLGEGYSSLFAYCMRALHLSEPAAYSRITAARLSRRFPTIITMLAQGELTLTTVTLLAAHLTAENHEALLDGARHRTKREVEELIACLYPQPDIPSSLRRLPATAGAVGYATSAPPAEPSTASQPLLSSTAPSHSVRASVARTVVAPVAPERYVLKITMGAEAHSKLQRARALLRHTVPSGDPAVIVDRALTVLVEQLEKRKCGATQRPRAGATGASQSRHVPAAVKRVIWARDGGRCAFVGSQGRCAEIGFLEFHHIVPFAEGGATNVDNLELRCRAHNAYEASVFLANDRLAEPSH